MRYGSDLFFFLTAVSLPMVWMHHCLSQCGLSKQKYRTGSLTNNSRLILTALEAGESKIKVLAALVPGESPLICRWLSLRYVLMWPRDEGAL